MSLLYIYVHIRTSTVPPPFNRASTWTKACLPAEGPRSASRIHSNLAESRVMNCGFGNYRGTKPFLTMATSISHAGRELNSGGTSGCKRSYRHLEGMSTTCITRPNQCLRRHSLYIKALLPTSKFFRQYLKQQHRILYTFFLLSII